MTNIIERIKSRFTAENTDQQAGTENATTPVGDTEETLLEETEAVCEQLAADGAVEEAQALAHLISEARQCADDVHFVAIARFAKTLYDEEALRAHATAIDGIWHRYVTMKHARKRKGHDTGQAPIISTKRSAHASTPPNPGFTSASNHVLTEAERAQIRQSVQKWTGETDTASAQSSTTAQAAKSLPVPQTSAAPHRTAQEPRPASPGALSLAEANALRTRYGAEPHTEEEWEQIQRARAAGARAAHMPHRPATPRRRQAEEPRPASPGALTDTQRASIRKSAERLAKSGEVR